MRRLDLSPMASYYENSWGEPGKLGEKEGINKPEKIDHRIKKATERLSLEAILKKRVKSEGGFRMRKNRLFQIGIIISVLLMVSFWAYGQDFQGQEVRWLFHGSHFESGFKPWSEKWAAEHNAKVITTVVPFEDLYQKLMTELVGGGGDYDIIQYMYPWGGTVAGGGYLLPLSSYIDVNSDWWKDITPVNQKAGMWNGEIYGLTHDGDTHMFYFRKDIFENEEEKANFKAQFGYDLRPPVTWDEYLDAAKFFTRNKGDKLAGEVLTQDFYGAAELLGRPNVYWWFLTRFSNFSVPYFVLETMDPKINGPEAVRCLENMINCLPFMPPGVLNFGWAEGNAAFMNGQAAMIVIWTDTGKRANAPELSKIVGKVGYGLVPGWLVDGKLKQRTFLSGGGWILGVLKDAKHKEAALSLIQYLTGPEVSLVNVTDYNTAMDPYRYSHIKSEKFRNLFPQAGEFLDAIEKNFESGWPELALPGGSEYMDVLGLYVHRALNGELKPQDALNIVAEEWKKITKKYGLEEQKKIFKEFMTPYLPKE